MASAELALSDEQTIEYLSAVAASDGSPRIAKRRLAEKGVEVEERVLRDLVNQNQGMYQALAVERAGAMEEGLAQAYREQAGLSLRVTKGVLEELAGAIDEGGVEAVPYELRRQLPQVVQALAKVQQVSTDKLLALTGRPADGPQNDPMQAAKFLVDLGVLTPRERPQIVDSTAEEE